MHQLLVMSLISPFMLRLNLDLCYLVFSFLMTSNDAAGQDILLCI